VEGERFFKLWRRGWANATREPSLQVAIMLEQTGASARLLPAATDWVGWQIPFSSRACVPVVLSLQDAGTDHSKISQLPPFCQICRAQPQVYQCPDFQLVV
jgi:hypothetical protein